MVQLRTRSVSTVLVPRSLDLACLMSLSMVCGTMLSTRRRLTGMTIFALHADFLQAMKILLFFFANRADLLSHLDELQKLSPSVCPALGQMPVSQNQDEFAIGRTTTPTTTATRHCFSNSSGVDTTQAPDHFYDIELVRSAHHTIVLDKHFPVDLFFLPFRLTSGGANNTPLQHAARRPVAIFQDGVADANGFNQRKRCALMWTSPYHAAVGFPFGIHWDITRHKRRTTVFVESIRNRFSV